MIAVNRGNKGVAVINLSLDENVVKLPTSLPDGEYMDQVYGNTFTVENKVLSGTAAPETTYIIVAGK